MPTAMTTADIDRLVKRRHPEWSENQKRWRWLADSYEGGNRYRHADYAADPTGTVPGGVASEAWLAGTPDPTTGESARIGFNQVVERNLVPHVSETGDGGRDVYLLRLARTPVPKTLERAIRRHLSRIYAREVKRSAPAALTAWWEDVDGMGTPIDKWMRKVVAPMLCVYGNLDLCFDRPRPDGPTDVLTRADTLAAGLDTCVASYILPENVAWWKLDRRGRYLECTVIERDEDCRPRFRHWTATESTLYGAVGDERGRAIETVPHPFGRVPIVRIFDDRKLRLRNVGQPRYESIAEIQKAIYNGKSELILGDVFHSHPVLQGPEKYLQDDSQIPVGPGNILPNFVTPDGTLATFSYLDPPQGGAEAQRQHVLDYGDEADRDAALMKPAGAATGSTVSQSGISKAFDSQEGNDYLAEVSETLADAEKVISEFATTVLADGRPDAADLDAVAIAYPKEFDLFTAEDLASAIADIQGLAASAGQLPIVESELFDRLVRILLPGIDDAKLSSMRSEVDGLVNSKAEDRNMARESGIVGRTAAEPDPNPDIVGVGDPPTTP